MVYRLSNLEGNIWKPPEEIVQLSGFRSKLSGHYRLFFKGMVDGMVGGLQKNKSQRVNK